MVKRFKRHGFTLIELLVVMAIIATLLSLVAPRYFSTVDRSKEAVLRENLTLARDAIDQYFADTGRYPDSLDDLIGKKYLRKLPYDPIVESASAWIVIAPSDPDLGAVFDIRSAAEGAASDGVLYGEI